jgi:hypothetical protein
MTFRRKMVIAVLFATAALMMGCEPEGEGNNEPSYEKTVCRDADGWLVECK